MHELIINNFYAKVRSPNRINLIIKWKCKGY